MFAHSGTLRQFAEFAREAGIDLGVLNKHLLAGMERSQRDDYVPAQLVADILQHCALLSHRPDLGIAFIAWANLRRFSPFSLFWDICPTISDLARLTEKFGSLENEGFATKVFDEREEVALCHYCLAPARYGSGQFIEASFALDMRLIRAMLGAQWHPLRVEFTHVAPDDQRAHRATFGCQIVWGADRNAMIVSRTDLHRPSRNANRQMLLFLEKRVAADTAGADDFPKRVQMAVAAHLAGGHANADKVAALLAVSRRTMQRRLAENGMNFAEILRASRTLAAQDYLASGAVLNLCELSHRLGYGEASAASRFLKQHFGTGLKALKRPSLEAKMPPGRG